MRAKFFSATAGLVIALLVMCSVTLAQEKPAEEKMEKKGEMKGEMKAKKTMSMYMVTVPHTAEQCLTALDEMSSEAPKMLKQARFGCASGDHTAYAMVEAENPEAVKAMMPKSVRETAKIVKVEKYTPEQIKKMHEGKM